MFRTKLPHMLCVKCNAKVVRGAYYCKSCGEVIDEKIAPGSTVEDESFISKLKYALSRHLIRNSMIGIFSILFIFAGVRLGIHHFQAVKDNNSSRLFQITVVEPQLPMTCRGAVCHINIDIRNKTATVQKITALPDFVINTGQKFGPADPARMGNGINYCQTKITLVLQPHQAVRYLGLCSADMPTGSVVTLVELRALSGNLIVSGALRAATY
jgi:hypothetical protein